MRSPDARTYRLTFTLPKGAMALPSGNFTNWVRGCELNICGALIAIIAPSREKAMEQAARLLRVACARLARIDIAALLESPAPVSGRDSWTIVVNTDVAFVPGAIGATFPEMHDGARHALG
jgi:hypothetical protein